MRMPQEVLNLQLTEVKHIGDIASEEEGLPSIVSPMKAIAQQTSSSFSTI